MARIATRGFFGCSVVGLAFLVLAACARSDILVLSVNDRQVEVVKVEQRSETFSVFGLLGTTGGPEAIFRFDDVNVRGLTERTADELRRLPASGTS